MEMCQQCVLEAQEVSGCIRSHMWHFTFLQRGKNFLKIFKKLVIFFHLSPYTSNDLLGLLSICPPACEFSPKTGNCQLTKSTHNSSLHRAEHFGPDFLPSGVDVTQAYNGMIPTTFKFKRLDGPIIKLDCRSHRATASFNVMISSDDAGDFCASLFQQLWELEEHYANGLHRTIYSLHSHIVSEWVYRACLNTGKVKQITKFVKWEYKKQIHFHS